VDIQGYFDSNDPGKLLAKLKQRIDDRAFMRLPQSRIWQDVLLFGI
jgi:hypothetical protein